MGVSESVQERGGIAMGVSSDHRTAVTPSGNSLNKLSDARVRAFAAKRSVDQATKLSDGGGLFLVHTKAGTPVWRIKYRFGGVERLYSVGRYPGITLQSARAERDVVRAQLREGIDPVQARVIRRTERIASSAETFEAVAGEWFEKNKRFWSDVHYTKARQAFDRDVFPIVGRLPVADITPAVVALVISKILERGVAETASKILQHVNGVFRLAQARGFRTDNPAAPARELIPRKRTVTPRPALLEIESLRDVMRRVDAANISEAVRLRSRLVAFTSVRLGNAVMAEWSEFELDGETPTWTIPRDKMKAKDRPHDHRVYLGPTIANDLRTWQKRTGSKGYTFPGNAGRAFIGREAVEKVYRETLKLAGRMSPHGWRSALSTLAKDAGWSRDVVELTLDHVHDSAVVRAYDRGERRVERMQLAAWWDAQLNPPAANVIPISSARSA
jgi:integrase